VTLRLPAGLGAFQYRWSSTVDPVTVEDYRVRARKAVPRMVWAYIDGGAETEGTLRANREAFEAWTLRARVLRGEAATSLQTTVANTRLSMPVVLAPTGLIGLAHWHGEVGCVRAAERVGTRAIVSTASTYSFEEVAAATPGDHFFQLYPWSDRAGTRELVTSMLRRAERAGYAALFVTVDVPVHGNRERERRAGMGVPPVVGPATLFDAVRRPRWTYGLMRHQRMSARVLVDDAGGHAALRSVQAQYRLMRPEISWQDLRWVRDAWEGPLFVKGILDADDAEQAADVGADGVVVSNHGGRQLDGAPATLEVLPEIAARVGDRLEVLLDGGVRRGTDVIKALCLGATAVCIGRPYVYGLAAGGERGVEHVLRIFREEIERALTLMGVVDVAELDQSWLRPAGATTAPLTTAHPEAAG